MVRIVELVQEAGPVAYLCVLLSMGSLAVALLGLLLSVLRLRVPVSAWLATPLLTAVVGALGVLQMSGQMEEALAFVSPGQQAVLADAGLAQMLSPTVLALGLAWFALSCVQVLAGLAALLGARGATWAPGGALAAGAFSVLAGLALGLIGLVPNAHLEPWLLSASLLCTGLGCAFVGLRKGGDEETQARTADLSVVLALSAPISAGLAFGASLAWEQVAVHRALAFADPDQVQVLQAMATSNSQALLWMGPPVLLVALLVGALTALPRRSQPFRTRHAVDLALVGALVLGVLGSGALAQYQRGKFTAYARGPSIERALALARDLPTLSGVSFTLGAWEGAPLVWQEGLWVRPTPQGPTPLMDLPVQDDDWLVLAPGPLKASELLELLGPGLGFSLGVQSPGALPDSTESTRNFPMMTLGDLDDYSWSLFVLGQGRPAEEQGLRVRSGGEGLDAAKQARLKGEVDSRVVLVPDVDWTVQDLVDICAGLLTDGIDPSEGVVCVLSDKAPVSEQGAQPQATLPEGLDPEAFTGTLDQDLIEAVMRRQSMSLRACAMRMQQEDPSLQGNVRLYMLVSTDGSVTESFVIPGTLDNSTLSSCLERAARNFHFPEPSGGPMVIEWPMQVDAQDSP